MLGRYEFRFHELAANAVATDAALAQLGAEGWEIRGISRSGDDLVVALQRALAETTAVAETTSVAESAAIVANLDAPLVAPSAQELKVSDVK